MTPLLKLSAAIHVAGTVALAAAPSKWPWIGSMIFLDHVFLAAVGMWPRSQWLGPNFSQLPASATHNHAVGLSFDDGPDPQVTPRVLDLLDQYGVSASFFCIGRRAEEHPDLVLETVRRGHRLENHTYRHPNSFAFFSSPAMGREIDRTQEILERLGGRQPVFFRAPAGIRNPWLDAVLVRRGLTLASWTHRGFDTVERDPRRVTRRLLKGLTAGDIALLHDGSPARDRNGQPVVLEALPRWLDAVAEQGLHPIPLPDPALNCQ
jgi:peptidoglycan/xylan/chitin deacetylase (PgdA/CDA1 family)